MVRIFVSSFCEPTLRVHRALPLIFSAFTAISAVRDFRLEVKCLVPSEQNPACRDPPETTWIPPQGPTEQHPVTSLGAQS